MHENKNTKLIGYRERESHKIITAFSLKQLRESILLSFSWIYVLVVVALLANLNYKIITVV